MSGELWTSERLARLGLTSLSPVPAKDLTRLVAQFGAVDTWEWLCSPDCSSRLSVGARQTEPDRIAAATEASGAQFLIPGDAGWPSGVDDLAHVDACSGVGGPPIGLWTRGAGEVAIAAKQAVAVVGSRACSDYGSGVAAELAYGLASGGCTVVSGGAYGIDAAAHRGALASRGSTIAVLACGVDVCYPRGNQTLFDQILGGGLIVSELPPGTRPSRAGFLARNRLIAALGQATVIVEAGARSGARNTATWASQLNRVLAAVPGPVDSVGAITPHQLIRDGFATLVTSAEDIAELVSPLGGSAQPDDSPADRDKSLTGDESLVFQKLSVRASRTAGEIAARTGLGVGKCLACLATLEAEGLAALGARGWLRVR